MEPGELVAERFEIERLAGSGGMAEVYRARDVRSGKYVALKIVTDRTPMIRSRFMREAEVLAELRHPAIVSYVAHGGPMDGPMFLAMEWLEGEDLFSRLERGPLGVEETLVLARRVSEALALLHARKVVHRDIKPSNLFLRDGKISEIMLLDFGIARLNTSARSMTRTGIMVGTPGYMSPEQARGGAEVDARADIFALGAVMYECLTGEPAFVGEKVIALLAKILLEGSPRVIDKCPDVPPPLDALVARMMAKTPDERPRDGAELRALLDAPDFGTPADGLRRTSIPSPALTADEQRTLCVILAGSDRTSGASGGTLGFAPETDEVVRIRRAIEPFDGQLEALGEGSSVVTFSHAGAATDQAVRAAQCALAMRSVLRRAPIALATGRGMVAERWPVGEVLERAARQLAVASAWPAAHPDEPGAPPIRIDEVTLDLLSERFEVVSDANGFELRGEPPRADATRTLLGKPTPCVGRERELGVLRGIFAQCVDDAAPCAVVMTGAAGEGKSRLRHEFVRTVKERDDDVLILIARGDPLGDATPFGMLGQVIRAASGILEGEKLSERHEKLRACVSRVVPAADARRVVEFLGEIVRAPFADSESVQLRAARQDPTSMADQMRRAWIDWLSAEARTRPVLIVLEDLQWGDPPTVQFVDAALQNARDLPWMVLAVARPELHDRFRDLWAGRPLQTLRLRELPPRACERLVRIALGDEVAPDTVERVITQSGGNAFYLEELIRAVARGRGAALPETVLAMVQARLEDLEPDLRRTLRAASVFGRQFWSGGVHELLGRVRRSDVETWLAELVAREVVQLRSEKKFPGETEYLFRNALLREAVYGMLTEQDRGLGHRLAAGWLERMGSTDAALLAEHYERGGIAEKAAVWYGRAAEQAQDAHDVKSALSHAQHGLACGASGELHGALKLVEADAYRWLGDLSKCEAAAREVLRRVRVGSVAWCTAAGILSMAAPSKGDDAGLVAVVQQLAGLEPSPEARAAYAIACGQAATQLQFSGAYELASLLGKRLEQASAAAGGADPFLAAWNERFKGASAGAAGDPGAFLEHNQRAAEAFERAGHLPTAITVRSNCGFALTQIGEYEQAVALLRETVDASQRLALFRIKSYAKSNLGLALMYLGHTDESQRLEREVIDEAREHKDVRLGGFARVCLALALRAAGALPVAEQEARAAVDSLSAFAPAQAFASAALASILLDQGQLDEALFHSHAAIEVLNGLGAIDVGESLVRLVRAEALHACGEFDRAREAIQTARDRLLERAGKIQSQVQRASFLVNVPDHARTIALAGEWIVAG